MRTFLILGFIALLMGSAGANAATFIVDSDTDSTDQSPGDGTCADSTGQCTLRAAVMEANALPGADTITFAGLPANSVITLTREGQPDEAVDESNPDNPTVTETPDASSGDLDITDSLVIEGLEPDQVDAITITWSRAVSTPDRIFQVIDQTPGTRVTFRNLTLTGGAVQESRTVGTGGAFLFERHGGAIAVGSGATVTAGATPVPAAAGNITRVRLERVLIYGCDSAGNGGAIASEAPLTVYETVIANNSATRGGGIYSTQPVRLLRATVGGSPNSGGGGGPIAPISFISSTLEPQYVPGNVADLGGGLYDTGFHDSRLEKSGINLNTATRGAGVYVGALTKHDVINTTFSANTASGAGAGILAEGDVHLRNVTFRLNRLTSTADAGAGVSVHSAGGRAWIGNSLMDENELDDGTPQDCGCDASLPGACPDAYFTTGGYNLEHGDTCGFLVSANDRPGVNSTVSGLNNVDQVTGTQSLTHFHQMSGGDDADLGSNALCPNTDQRGFIRPSDGNTDGSAFCDAGAYERFRPYGDLYLWGFRVPDQAFVGDVLSIELEPHNDDPGQTTADTVAELQASSGIDLISAQYSIGGGPSQACSATSSQITCSLGDLPSYSAVTISASAAVTAAGDHTISASVASPTYADPTPGNNNAQAHVQALGSADISVATNVLTAQPGADADVTVRMTAVNEGPEDATGTRLAVELPDQISFVDAPPQCRLAGGDVLCELGTVTAMGDRPQLDITVHTADAEPRIIRAAILADQTDPNNQDNTDSDTVNPGNTIDLSLAVSHTPSTPVIVGDEAETTWTVINEGTQTATNVSLSVTIPQGLEYVDGSGTDCTTASGGSTVTCTLPDLLTDATASTTFRLRAIDGGDWSLLGEVFANQSDANTSNNAATEIIDVSLPVSDLSLTVNAADVTIEPGEQTDIEWNISNSTGSDPANDVQFSATVPGELMIVSVAPTAACSVTGGTVQCGLGSLAPGGTAAPVTLTIEGGALSISTIDASALSSSDDPQVSDNTTETRVEVARHVSDLALGVQASAGEVDVGEMLELTYTVTNGGPESASDVSVQVQIPTELTVSSAPGCADLGGGTWSCDLGTIAAQASAATTLQVSATESGIMQPSGEVSSSSSDPSGDNNASFTEFTVVLSGGGGGGGGGSNPASDLALAVQASSATATVGDSLSLTFEVSNQGPDAAADVTVQVQIPVELSVVMPSPCTGTGGGAWTCALGTIPANSTGNVVMDVEAVDAGSVEPSGTVQSSSSDPSGDNDAGTTTISISAPPGGGGGGDGGGGTGGGDGGSGSGGGSSGDGIGGCTVTPGAPFDPILPILAVIALAGLARSPKRAAAHAREDSDDRNAAA